LKDRKAVPPEMVPDGRHRNLDQTLETIDQ